MRFRVLGMMLLAVSASGATAAAGGLDSLIGTINAVERKGEGNRQAIAAWQQLSQSSADQLTEILSGMDDERPLAVNWLAAAVEVIADRELARGGALPSDALEAYVLDTSQSRRSRRLAFQLLRRIDPTAPDRLIPGMLHDPSVDFRRDAVARLLDRAEALFSDGDRDAALPIYQQAMSAARDLDQIKQISERLATLDHPVDLPRHFGFLMRWHLIGPFDNTGSLGFDVHYPPEHEIDLAAKYPGKGGVEVAWIEHETTDDYGMVDLNKALGKANGVVAYALAEFVSRQARDVELRLGCITANKVWLNGELLHERNVYHAGTQLDQFIIRGRLKPGPNQILVKVCQNEQTEDWAQSWQFQLRVCDSTGTAILSDDRPEAASVEAADIERVAGAR